MMSIIKVNITTTLGMTYVQHCETLEDALDFVEIFKKINLFPEYIHQITVRDSSSKVLASWEGGTRKL